VPPSLNAILSAAGKNIPVLVSPVVVIDGAAAEPAAKEFIVTQELPFHRQELLLAEYVSFSAGDAGKFNAGMIFIPSNYILI
jgi:hypothetical protein